MPTLRPVSDPARLADVAERPRVGDWSLRAALVRYGQRDPIRVQQLLEVVRRYEGALKPHVKHLQKGEVPDEAVDLLEVGERLDAVADLLAAWARDPHGTDRPDDAVDEATTAAAARLDELGVAREEAPPRPGPGGRPRRPRASRGT